MTKILGSRLLIVLLCVWGIGLFAYLLTLKPKGVEDTQPGAIPSKAADAASVRPAPDFAFVKDTPGLPAHLSNLKGKVVILDFWATWCGPCRMSIPALQKLHEKYAAQGLQVIGVSVDEAATRDQVPAAAKELGMTYPVIYALDIPDLRDNYQFNAIPQMFVIDKQGKIRYEIRGYNPDDSLDDKIAPLLKE